MYLHNGIIKQGYGTKAPKEVFNDLKEIKY